MITNNSIGVRKLEGKQYREVSWSESTLGIKHALNV